MDASASLEKRQSTRLFIVLLLIGAFFVVELIGAKIARSDVLQADAFHLLMDVFALAISLTAMRVASRRPSSRFTFGLRRAEPVAALANGVLVIGVVVELVRDSIEHLGKTSEPQSGIMLAVASAALVMNGLNAWLLHGAMGHHGHGHHGHGHHGHSHAPARKSEHAHEHAGSKDGHVHENAHAHAHEHVRAKHEDAHDHDCESDHAEDRGHQLNLRGAWLHLLGDALGSVAAFGAGLAIRLGASPLVDPLASFVVVIILVIGAIRLLRDAGLVLLEAAPPHLPVPKVEKALLAIEGISHVSNLHVWSLGTGHDAITARVRTSSLDPKFGAATSAVLRERFSVEYVTVEVEVE